MNTLFKIILLSVSINDKLSKQTTHTAQKIVLLFANISESDAFIVIEGVGKLT